ncbi:TPR domain protein [Plesiocystis pacifica SIR-1]|uniref:TPR domain protein n=1 Tax=Plesiocystis pacifica SIR-1 TaxID=391625 RepID=A6GHC6_9BACT|nr:tetratricopeptide repeat protein [Plesiocystis pacifica]EDM74741.1 TPR domain protein [Plesiocystis pacifica SIR-1]
MAFQRDKALQAAQQFAARGELDKAMKELQGVVEAVPGDTQAWLLFADCLQRAGKLDLAVERYVHAANLLLSSNEVPQALQVYRQVLNLAPERYDVHLSTAQAFEQLRRVPEAVALYEKVAGVYLRSGNTREALMLYERVADLMPREMAKRLRLAELFSRERRTDDAVEHFRRGADFLRDAGRHQEYVRVAERLLYHRQVDAVIRDLVRVYLELDQPRRALMKLNELLQRVPTDALGLELLADTFVRLGKTDKAVSVVLELVKIQRDPKAGADGLRHAVAVLRKAAEWAPDNADVAKLLAELGPQVPAEEVEELSEFEEIEEIDELSEFEEIEEFDEVEELEEVAPTPTPTPTPPPRTAAVPSPRRASLTEEVISEGDQASPEESGEVDIDKHLEEVRVLTKYKLFEHALVHADQILGAQPHHLQALEMRASILSELERHGAAVQTWVYLGELVAASDPAAGAAHAQTALEIDPTHGGAQELAERCASVLSATSEAEPELAPAVPTEFDDDPLGIDVSESLVIGDDDDDDLGDLDLDLGLGGDLVTEPLSAHTAPPSRDVEVVAPAREDSEGNIDIGSADPSLTSELNRLVDDEDDFAISVDTGSEVTELPREEDFEDRFGLDDEDEEDFFGSEDEAASEAVEESTGRPVVGRISPDTPDAPDAPDPGEDGDFDFGFGEPEPEPGSEPEPAPQQGWPDISGELDELDFYLDNELEDDAVAAYNDLSELYPGHPELAKVAARLGLAAPETEPEVELEPEPESEFTLEPEPESEFTLEPEPESEFTLELEPEPESEFTLEDDEDGAAPLLDLEDEDDDDDFLSAIFDDSAPKTRKKREVAIQTNDVEDADAGDRFDLGTAYREMGLIDKAIAEYATAAKDPRWQAKALVQMGMLRLQQGNGEGAMEHFSEAASVARTKDERCQANYELAMALLDMGREDEAREALERVDAGFRDRDEKLMLLA